MISSARIFDVCLSYVFSLFFFTAIDTAKLWIIDRRVFQTIMMRTGMMRQAEHIAFLKRYRHMGTGERLIASLARYIGCPPGGGGGLPYEMDGDARRLA